MNLRTRTIIVVSAFAALSGCVTVRQNWKDEGLKSASFAMSCPAEELKSSRLDGDFDEKIACDYGTIVAKVGVRGCEQKAVYALVCGGGWIADTISSSPATSSTESKRGARLSSAQAAAQKK